MHPFKSGYVSLIGWPNVGKSTLMNAFLGSKLSIVSPRPQTTREAILGILNEPGIQMVFADTPGWLSPQDAFQNYMKRSIVRSIYDDADVVLWLLEPKPFAPEDVAFADKLKKSNKPIVVAVNKMDLAGAHVHFDAIKTELGALLGHPTPVLAVSAKSRAGLNELKGSLISRLPEAQPYFPTDQMTDRWERFYVAELIREQIFKRYQEEVPHACLVMVENFVEKQGRKDVIKASIIVETEGQKKIVIGGQAKAIRDLGAAARKEIEAQIGRPVFLELIVKVHKNWRQDGTFLKLALGTGA